MRALLTGKPSEPTIIPELLVVIIFPETVTFLTP
jgi:hypothetical protein